MNLNKNQIKIKIYLHTLIDKQILYKNKFKFQEYHLKNLLEILNLYKISLDNIQL
jgi:hypothetical protein